MQKMIEQQSTQKLKLREQNKMMGNQYGNGEDSIIRRLDLDKKYDKDQYDNVPEKYWSDRKNQMLRNEKSNPL